MKQETKLKQAKYLQMTQKSGCISADYSVTELQEDTVVVLSDDIQKSGYYHLSNGK